MAIVVEGMPCALCGEPMLAGQPILSMTFLGLKDLRFQFLDDAAFHQECMDNWPRKAEFVESWNEEAGPELGRANCLWIDRDGHVRYKRDIFLLVFGAVVGAVAWPFVLLGRLYRRIVWRGKPRFQCVYCGKWRAEAEDHPCPKCAERGDMKSRP